MPSWAKNEHGFLVVFADNGKEATANSFAQIREIDFERDDYSDEPAEGWRNVVLHRKLWLKGASGFKCFFEESETKARYGIGVFRDRKSETYLVGEFDLLGVSLGTKLSIQVRKTRTENFRLDAVERLSPIARTTTHQSGL